MHIEPIARGKVEWLCIDGMATEVIGFNLDGPEGDAHSGHTRKLSGHDSEYLWTSELVKRESVVFNWRSWTGLAVEEIREVEAVLKCDIPKGCLLENIGFSGIPNFSHLPPTSRIVFPKYGGEQLILAVWEENGPCHGVGDRLAKHYDKKDLSKQFISAAQCKRGVMGFVLSPGWVEVGDEVVVYPPASAPSHRRASA
ncbi:MAG: molybdenum cofactor sulfurase [Parcubacteria group bacterium]|nr:molybdenum cofactor sulfurase [Parcubacteria group bacterium]